MGKEVKMNGQKEPTREELMGYVQQLQNQNQALITKLNEVNNFTMFKRCDYLFEIVKQSEKFPSDFVEKCVKEIVSFITIPEQPEQQPENTEEKKEEDNKE